MSIKPVWMCVCGKEAGSMCKSSAFKSGPIHIQTTKSKLLITHFGLFIQTKHGHNEHLDRIRAEQQWQNYNKSCKDFNRKWTKILHTIQN